MKRRYSIYLALIALLIMVNIVRWLTHFSNGAEGAATHSKIFLPEDFHLRMGFPADAALHRNLFQPKGDTPRATKNRASRMVAKAAVQPTVQQEQTEVETAGGSIGRLKLLGVVFRSGKGQAYLALEKESVIALAGDTVLGQFTVDKVDVDAVELHDLKNNTSRRIPVSGK